MKVRNGFVSNSSSSSFIIFLDKKPSTIEETKELFLGDAELYPDPYYDLESSYFKNRPKDYPALQVAETVFDDLKDQKPMSKKQIVSELKSGRLPRDEEDYSLDYTAKKMVLGIAEPNYDSFEDSLGNMDWERYDKAHKNFCNEVASKLLSEEGIVGKEAYLSAYSDACS